MKRSVTVLLLCLLAIGHALADYALPEAKERLVLLLELKDVKLDKHRLVFPVNKVAHKFKVDEFWMQDRIWSDGICVGVEDSDPKSSAARIREVQLAIANKQETLLLVELVRVAGTNHFVVTYLKLFDPEKEYKRYFPKKELVYYSYDTINLPFDSKPKQADGFVDELKKTTLVSLQRLNRPKRIDAAKAGPLFTEHLVKLGLTPKSYAFSLSPFGQSTWIISCYLKGISPSLPWRHVMNSRGEVGELTMDSLNVVFLNEWPSTPKEDSRKALVQNFVELHAGEKVIILKATSDIPGYDKAPLDEDLAKTVRAPFSFGKVVSVVYTYQRIEGIVRRYRFEFENSTAFKRAQCAILSRDIGDAQYYE